MATNPLQLILKFRFFVFVLCLQFLADTNSGSARRPINLTYPEFPGDLHGVVGETLQLWCSIDSLNTEYHSSDLEVILCKHMKGDRYERLNAAETRVVNDSTIEVNFNIPSNYYYRNPLRRTSFFECFHRHTTFSDCSNRNDISDRQYVNIGYRPFMPVIDDYRVYNWDYFIFRWHFNSSDPVYPTNPVYVTKYEAWYKARNRFEEFKSCCQDAQNAKSCRKRVEVNFECRISNILQNVTHPTGMIWFKVNGSNVVGQETVINSVYVYHIIQPGTVKNLTVTSHVSTGVVAKFVPPKPDKDLTFHLRVSCRSYTMDFYLTDAPSTTRRRRHPLRYPIKDPGLPAFSNCILSVRCLPLHETLYWSDWSNHSFISPDGIPQVGPSICSGCFDIKFDSDSSSIRRVTLYYKHLSEAEANGKVVDYVIKFASSRSETVLPYTEEISVLPTDVSATFDVYNDAAYALSVNARTGAGSNRSVASSVNIPKQTEILSSPENITVIWYGLRNVRVSWSSMHGIQNYTVVWCRGKEACDETLSWKQITPNVLHSDLYNDIDLGPRYTHYKDYRYGLTVSSLSGISSGIKWIDCVYDINKGSSAPDLRLFNATGTRLFLTLDKPVCERGNHGYVYQYNFYHFRTHEKLNDQNVLTLNLPQLDKTDWFIAIDNLEPAASYNCCVVAVTFSGSSEMRCIAASLPTLTASFADWAIGLLSTITVVFIPIGVYTCYRCHRDWLRRFKRWLNLEITVPNQQIAIDRGNADGVNSSELSSSYTSLKNLKDNNDENCTVTIDVDVFVESQNRRIAIRDENEPRSNDRETKSEERRTNGDGNDPESGSCPESIDYSHSNLQRTVNSLCSGTSSSSGVGGETNRRRQKEATSSIDIDSAILRSPSRRSSPHDEYGETVEDRLPVKNFGSSEPYERGVSTANETSADAGDYSLSKFPVQDAAFDKVSAADDRLDCYSTAAPGAGESLALMSRLNENSFSSEDSDDDDDDVNYSRTVMILEA